MSASGDRINIDSVYDVAGQFDGRNVNASLEVRVRVF